MRLTMRLTKRLNCSALRAGAGSRAACDCSYLYEETES
ncbi:hypothetical protein BURMUCF2_A0197 [Burkholderia multivorans CF2]|nr:hypothetical protein BURMUCF2_A0197 [Burkholderia multivorans CF2]